MGTKVFFYYFCFMIAGSGSVPRINGSGSGRPKNVLFLRIRIRYYGAPNVPMYQDSDTESAQVFTPRKRRSYQHEHRCTRSHLPSNLYRGIFENQRFLLCLLFVVDILWPEAKRRDGGQTTSFVSTYFHPVFTKKCLLGNL